MLNTLINTADLTALIKSGEVVEVTARASLVVEGFMMHIQHDDQALVLSTYLSEKPRLFKRADALLKEAKKMGVSSVRFDLEINAL